MEARLAFGLVEDTSEKGLDDSVKEVFDWYNVVRDMVEMNRPESYVHQVGDRLIDDKLGEQGTGSEGQGVARAGGPRQSKLALNSRKGKVSRLDRQSTWT
jgi:hypothetical protein